MVYYFTCPICNTIHDIEWQNKHKLHKCPVNGTPFWVPDPAEQHEAFVNTHEWPQEMELAVISLKTNKCCVPGCIKYYETLDHRVPFSKGGKTSVENLQPMCNEHNQLKGDKNWELWMLTRE